MLPLRKLAKHVVPKPAHHAIKKLIDSDYRVRCEWERDRQLGKLVYESTDGVVVGGPFAGLRYVDSAMGSSLGPKLLGTYEKELYPIVDQIVARGYQTIINIGAGEGYYAVGLAKRVPHAKVICFEALASNRPQIRRLSELNGVADRVEIRGFCTADSLTEVMETSNDVLIVCDVEGGEVDILQPDLAPALSHAHILMEMHDGLLPGCSTIIRRRFQWSHGIEVIWSQSRTLEDWPKGVEIDHKTRLACLNEDRGGPMSWFWMLPDLRFKSAMAIVR